MGNVSLLDSNAYLASRFAFHAMNAQALTGIAFDREAAEALVTRIQEEMKTIEEEIEPKLPPRKLKKGEEHAYRIPAKPFKKDGTLSATMAKWFERHGVTEMATENSIVESNPASPDCEEPPKGFWFRWRDGSFHTIEAGFLMPASAPMKLGQMDALKDWLLDIGWEPVFWNYKKGPNGRPERDKKTGQLIKTSPKLQETKVLCPNLAELQGDLVRPVVRWLSLRNRLSALTNVDGERGWLNDPRLDYDGRLSADSTGITNTHRQKHTNVVNIPKAEQDVILGKEMRGLFVARPGYVLVGYDAAAIENRVEAHYVYQFPGGPEYAAEILDGDPHKKNAFVFYEEQLREKGLVFDTTHKDDPAFKPFRSKSKNGKYCLSYGGQGPKLAKTLGLPEHMGDTLYNNFWEANLPLKMFKDQVTLFWETTGGKKWVRAIDGRHLMTRSKHSLVNVVFQSAGSITMDYSWMLMDKWLGKLTLDKNGSPCYNYKGFTLYRVAFMHDEFLLESPPEIAEEIGQLGVRSIEAAGRYLKFRVPLAAEYKVGNSWRETH